MYCCVECGKSFAPMNVRHKYCTRSCYERFRKRMVRLRRQQDHRCPQCGQVMIYRPVRMGRGKASGGMKISYCLACREKFRRIYQRKKQDIKGAQPVDSQD